jgi:hypothetical protein
MEGLSRTLIQEKAILVARQGDPQCPAPGTLLARQKILHAELETALARRSSPLAESVTAVSTAAPRHPDQIRRDIRRIENELIRVQARLREIDQRMAVAAARKRAGAKN